MNSNRLWIIASVLVMAMVVAGTVFLGVLPQLDAAAKADTERKSVIEQNRQLEADLVTLQQQFENLELTAALVDDLRIAIPDDEQMDDLLRYLDTIAKKAKVRVTTLVIAEPAPFVPSVESAESLEPGLDAANFYTISIQVTAKGNQNGIFKFTKLAQENPRVYLVNTVTTSSDDEGVYTLDLSGYSYLLRNPDGSKDAPLASEEEPTEEGGEETPAPTETPAAPGSTPTPTETPAP